MINWLRKLFCDHEFSSSSIVLTGMRKTEPHGERVWCRCSKCHNGFYARCGIELPGKLTR